MASTVANKTKLRYSQLMEITFISVEWDLYVSKTKYRGRYNPIFTRGSVITEVHNIKTLQHHYATPKTCHCLISKV